MSGKSNKPQDHAESLGLNANIPRRDFVGGTLVGAGAALLMATSPGAVAAVSAKESSSLPPLRGQGAAWRGIDLGDDWQGPGGLGDYAHSNGNTARVVHAAHAGVRNHEFEGRLASAADTNEFYDMVIVGAGISGLFGAYDLLRHKPDAKILILDNHAIFGGEAKQNELEVDGYRLYAPQGPSVYRSSDPNQANEFKEKLADELGLPSAPAFNELTGSTRRLTVPRDYWTPQLEFDQVDVGYFYDSTGFVINPHSNAFRDAPVSQKTKTAMAAILLANKRPIEPDQSDVRAWMDSMTYQEFLQKVYDADIEAVKICEDDMTAGGTGLGGDVYSAALASFGSGPYSGDFGANMVKNQFEIGFPTGNSGIARTLVKRFLPGAITGDTLTDVLFGKINWDELDKSGNRVRMRLNATVVGVRQNYRAGGRRTAMTYWMADGKMYRVRSKTVLMATPQMVNRNVCLDLPTEYQDAMAEFNHPPMLKVNVAVRHWRFMEKANITAFKWWGNYPAYGAILRSMMIDGKEIMPCDPGKPTVIPLYIPANAALRGMPLREQAFAARHLMYSLRFADIEMLIREQFTKMFAPYGFDAKRDIAGIIANRWGHAFICPGPGFFTGKEGRPAAASIIKRPLDAMAFSHSDLSGLQDWHEAARYARAGVERLVQSI